jgi:hypothetical protein
MPQDTPVPHVIPGTGTADGALRATTRDPGTVHKWGGHANVHPITQDDHRSEWVQKHAIGTVQVPGQ